MSRRSIEGLLLESGAYRDLEEPVIVTSGEFLTPFYVNAERLCGDPGIDDVLADLAEDDGGMIEYACRRGETDEGFAGVIEVLCEVVTPLLRARGNNAISGGQRRDWLFSGPVAARLGLPHVSLFKQSPGGDTSSDRVLLRSPDGQVDGDPDLEDLTVVHVVDMVTKASSCHAVDPATNREIGWVPLLRSRGAAVTDLVAVITRVQGGEQRLQAQGVAVHALAVVDSVFVAEHSTRPESLRGYVEDPAGWTRQYLQEKGVGALVVFLEDTPKKLPRMVKFLRDFRVTLEANGVWEDLDRESQARLGRGVEELLR